MGQVLTHTMHSWSVQLLEVRPFTLEEDAHQVNAVLPAPLGPEGPAIISTPDIVGILRNLFYGVFTVKAAFLTGRIAREVRISAQVTQAEIAREGFGQVYPSEQQICLPFYSFHLPITFFSSSLHFRSRALACSSVPP